MSLKKVKPFDGLRIRTTELDDMEVAHLLRTPEKLHLACQDCGGRRFKAEVVMTAEMDIITGDSIIIADVEYHKVMVNRVIKCSHCSCKEFVAIQEPDKRESKDEETNSSIGAGI